MNNIASMNIEMALSRLDLKNLEKGPLNPFDANSISLNRLTFEIVDKGLTNKIVTFVRTEKKDFNIDEYIKSEIVPKFDSLISMMDENRHKLVIEEIKKVLINRRGFKLQLNPRGVLTYEILDDLLHNFKTPYEFLDYLDLSITAL